MRTLAIAFLAAAAHAQATRAPLVGSVVDPDGKPLAGASVEAWRTEGNGTCCLDLVAMRDQRLVARAPTDARGRFGMQLPVGLPCQVRVDVAPHARWIRDSVLPSDDLKIQLARPAVFAGRVKLAGGAGAPAAIRAWTQESTEVLRGETDAAGAFRFERVPAGKLTVEVLPREARAPEWFKIELEAGALLERDVDVEPGKVLTGLVVDAEDKPIAGARVGEGWVLSKCVRTDADGRYELRGFGSSGHDEVHCTAEGYVRVLATSELVADPPKICFRLERGATATGTVVDAAGKPVPDVYVAGIGMSHDGRTQYHNWVGMRTGADGKFRLAGLRSNLQQTLLVRRDGFASLVYHLPKAKADGALDAGTVTLRPARVLRGRIVDGKGVPIARIKLGCWGTNSDREKLAKLDADGRGRDGWELLRMYLALREVWTNDQGEFAFGDLPEGSFDLVVYGPNNQRLESLESKKGLVIETGKEPAPVVIVLER